MVRIRLHARAGGWGPSDVRAVITESAEEER